MRALLVLLVLLVAGCSAPGDGGTTTSTPTGPGGLPAPRFDPPVDISGRNGGPEPVIVVGDDGAVWVAAQDAAGGAPRVWVSTDGARTFRVSRPSNVAGGEVDIAVGPGVAFVTQLGPNGNVVSYTRDKGATWTATSLAGTTYFERELVTVDAAGAAYLVSRFGLQQLTGRAQADDAPVARSDDGGVTFIPVGSAWDATHEPGTTIGNFIAYSGGIAMAYNCRDAQAVCFARSVDRGATWTQTVVAQRSVDVANVYPIVAASGGRLVVAWSDASDGRLAVWAASSTNDGASWTSPARVSDPGETATLPWVAMGAGRTWIVYAATDAPLADAGAASAQDARWFARAARVGDDLVAVERGNVLPDPVHVGVISKPIGNPGGGPRDRSFGDFFTVAVDRQGRALVAVEDTVEGAANVLVVATTG